MPAFWQFDHRPRWFKPPLLVGLAATGGIYTYAHRNQWAKDYDAIYSNLKPVIAARYSVFYRNANFQNCVAPCQLTTNDRDARTYSNLENRQMTLRSGTNGYFYSFINSERSQRVELNGQIISFTQSVSDSSHYKKARLFIYLDKNERSFDIDAQRISSVVMQQASLHYLRHYSIRRFGDYPRATGILGSIQEAALGSFPTINRAQATACFAMRLPNPIDYGGKSQDIQIDPETSCSVSRVWSSNQWEYRYRFDYSKRQPAHMPAPSR